MYRPSFCNRTNRVNFTSSVATVNSKTVQHHLWNNARVVHPQPLVNCRTPNFANLPIQLGSQVHIIGHSALACASSLSTDVSANQTAVIPIPHTASCSRYIFRRRQKESRYSVLFFSQLGSSDR